MGFNPEILQRFFKGKYSRKDFLIIKSAFGNPEMEAKLKNLLQNHWFDFNDKPLSEINIDNVLHKIHHQIHVEDRQTKSKRFIAFFQRAAAILIVPLVLSFLAIYYFQPTPGTPEMAIAEIQCPMGVCTKFVLPDGTTGFLNSGSTLEYPVIFTNHRYVKLQGEAFFDVAHSNKKPFTVKTAHTGIKVLGTRFNVMAYKNDNNEEVTLEQGKVEVSSPGGKLLDILQPGQKLVLNTTARTYQTKNVEALQYSAWTEGKLVFRNENMQEVAKRLGRWYNADIEIADKELMRYAFRATFTDEPLNEVLKLLALTAPLKYKIETRESAGAFN